MYEGYSYKYVYRGNRNIVYEDNRIVYAFMFDLSLILLSIKGGITIEKLIRIL